MLFKSVFEPTLVVVPPALWYADKLKLLIVVPAVLKVAITVLLNVLSQGILLSKVSIFKLGGNAPITLNVVDLVLR